MDMVFCIKRRKAYSNTDDIARDWDYYIPGIEWTPRRIKTITKAKCQMSSQRVKSRQPRKSSLFSRKSSLNSPSIGTLSQLSDEDLDDTLTTTTTTEIDYNNDPDEYMFSLPTKDDCLKALSLSQERLLQDQEYPEKIRKKSIKLEKQISSLQNKYNDFQVSIDIDDSFVIVKSPSTCDFSKQPTSGILSTSLWKSATCRVRKILKQFMDLIATPQNEGDLAIARSERTAISVDEQSSIIETTKETTMNDNRGFKDSGYLDDYDIPSVHSRQESSNDVSNDPFCKSNPTSKCRVHFVCEPSDGKSSLCIRCMRECKTTSSESSLLALGQQVPLSPFNAKNASELRNWHTQNNNNTQAISSEISKKIECMTPISTKDYTLDMDIPYIDQILKGSTSDMGLLFTTPSFADKYCLNHTPSKDNLRKQLFNEDEDEIDMGRLAEKCSHLSSPHNHKYLYCLTFDTGCNNDIDESSNNPIEDDSDSLIWNEM